MPPFRQPINTEDSPEPESEPVELPEYAKPHVEAQIPDYAKPHDAKAEVKPRSFKPIGAEKFYKATKGLVDKAKEFGEGVLSSVLPSTTPRDYLEGPAYALRHPIDSARLTGEALLKAHKEQYEKAKSSPTLSERIGHGAAAVLPIIGPAAASAGEDIGEGNITSGLGKATGLLAPFAIHGIHGVSSGSVEEAVKAPSVRQSREIPYRMEDAKTEAKGIPLPSEPPIKQDVELHPEFGPNAFSPKDYQVRDAKSATKTTEKSIPSDRWQQIFDERRAEQKPIEPDSTSPKPKTKSINPFKKETKTAKVPDYAKPHTETAEDTKSIDESNKQFAESPEEEEIPGKIPANDASKMSPEGFQKLNEFMQSVPKEGEQSVEDIRNSLNAPSVKQPIESTSEVKQPTATFKYEGPEGKMYDIQGGASDRSTVSAGKLKELGIDVPESPESSGERLTGAQLREKALAAKKPYTIENAPPNQRAKMFRGANEPIDILFNSPDDREMFGAGQKSPVGKNVREGDSANWYTRLNQQANRVSQKFGVTVQEAKQHIVDYNKTVRESGKAVDVNGGNITAPSFSDFVKSKIQPEAAATGPRLFSDEKGELNLSSIKSFMSDIYNKITGNTAVKDVIEQSKKAIPDIEAPKDKGTKVVGAVTKLLSALDDAKGSGAEQAQMYKVERARRFAASAGVKEGGVEGASKSLSKMKGEYDKVPGERLHLSPDETNSLFDAIKAAPMNEAQKIQGRVALFKLLSGSSVPQHGEISILDNVFGNGFGNKIVEMHGGIGMVGVKLSKLGATAKSMENSISLAAPLRHGIGLAYRKEFYPAFRDMFKFYANKDFYNASMQAIKEHPNYDLFNEAGGFLSKSGTVQNAEEEFLDSYVGNIHRATGIPQIVGASQRGYTGFLNKLRFDTFNSMTEQAKKLGTEMSTTVGEGAEKQTIASKEAKAIARYINVATGRGDLPFGLNKMTQELNAVLWSPRMMASRLTLFTNPKIYTELPKGMRLEGLKSLLGIAALGTTIDTLGTMAGAKVSTNLLSSDAGKSRFGTKLIDPWGGFQQYVVGAARFLAGKTDSAAPTSRLDIAGRFLANKESPMASLAHSLLTAKKFTGKSEDPSTAGNFTTEYGEKTSIQSEIGKRFVPIFIQDLHDLATSEPKWSDDIGLSAIMGVASLAGMSQDYPQKKVGSLSMKQRKLKP